MKLLIRAFWIVFLTNYSQNSFSQLIRNPSFEGPRGEAISPMPWTPCNNFSTPDTQPGIWSVYTQPSQGNSYLGLVARGNLGPYANVNEAAQIPLTTKLVAGKNYDFSIDLAYSTTQGHDVDWDFLSYGNPTKLKIWGGENSCEKTELLWESPTINHSNWQTYNFSILPTSTHLKFLILEVNHVALPTYFGNILIDNIVEKTVVIPDPAPDPFPQGCALETFNVFTPNNDGLNDLLQFKSPATMAMFKLKVYNRWGNLVFETDNIEKGWNGKVNGKKCASGVYYWHTEYICILNNTISQGSKKGFVTIIE